MSHPPVPTTADLMNRLRALVPLWEGRRQSDGLPVKDAVGRLVSDMKDFDSARTLSGELALAVRPQVFLLWAGDEVICAYRTEEDVDRARDAFIARHGSRQEQVTVSAVELLD